MGYCDAFTITRQQRLRFAHCSHLWLGLWHHCLKRSDLISVNPVLPIGVSKTLARALVDLNKARSFGQKLHILRRLRPRDLLPVPPAVVEYSATAGGTGSRSRGRRRRRMCSF